MIKDRPKHLLDQPGYNVFPNEPFRIEFDALPELLRKSLGPLGGIQPVTTAMFEAVGDTLEDMPSGAEIELFRNAKTRFQLISLVVNVANLSKNGDTYCAAPYALTLLPASKRGEVDERDIDAIAKLDIQKILVESQPCYVGFDPFAGDWGLYSPLSLLLEQKLNAKLDELGVVVGQYFLATTFDPEGVVESPLGFANPKLEGKYGRHRAKLLYQPFTKIATRRIWGAQSPIELFLFQELLSRKIALVPQVLFYDDGSAHSSLYHLWKDLEFRHAPTVIAEADFYIPGKKLAIFCDSNRYHRGGKARAKDAAIDERLALIGVKSVRVPGKLIVSDLKAAADLVNAAL